MSLCAKHYTRYYKTSPQLRIDRNRILYGFNSKETSLYACQKASLTVEATIVIPLVTVFLITILFFFHVLHIQARVEEALILAGRKVAVESCVVEEDALLLASAKALVLWELREEISVKQFVEGESAGIVLLTSEFSDDRILLNAVYRVRLPINLFGIDGITLWSRSAVQKWIGDLPKTPSEEWVYVSETGEVYHRLKECSALTIRVKSAFFSLIPMLRGKNGQKYNACSRCVEEITSNDLVYYTDYGELFHQRINCSRIKRTVEKKKYEEVMDRRPCKLCCGGDAND